MNHSARYLAMAVGLALAMIGATLAAQPGQFQYRQNDQQVLSLLDRLNRDARQFDRQIDLALGRNPDRPVNPSPIESDVDELVNELTDTMTHLRDHYARRQVVEGDVQEVMIRGARIDQFMRRNQFSQPVEASWRTVRGELDQLTRFFNVPWDWNSPRMDPVPGPAFYNRLSGTYQLDRSRSDDPARVATQATRGLNPVDRQRVNQNLTARLDAPDFIALDRNGRTVAMASDRAPMSRLDIDGQPRTETNPNGGVSTVRASFYGDELSVTTTGNRGRDFTVKFEPLDAGNGLRVTRTLDVASLNTPVTSVSVYRRTSDRPDWNVFHELPPPPPPRGGGAGGGAGIGIVPAGMTLIGQLNTPLGSRTSHQGDRFSITVNGPGSFQGAVVDGIVQRVGTGVGRNELIFDFDRIRLRDGRTGEFSGVLSQVQTPDGRLILVDRQGDVQAGATRSDQAIQGGAVGATIGAIIGAIAKGGKGAAIGAAIGATAGAGTLYAVGSDVDLPRGTEVRIISQPIWDRH